MTGRLRKVTVASVIAKAKCLRCRRRMTGAVDENRWNINFAKGVFVSVICPNCQTPEENAEAEVNFATLAYSTNAFGMPVTRPKAFAPEIGQ